MSITHEGTAGAGEGHHGQRHRNGDVDSDLADVNVLGELSGGGAVVGENGRPVAVLVRVDQLKKRKQFGVSSQINKCSLYL